MKRHVIDSPYPGYLADLIRLEQRVKAICGKVWIPTKNEPTTGKLCKGCKNELKRQIADRLALL